MVPKAADKSSSTDTTSWLRSIVLRISFVTRSKVVSVVVFPICRMHSWHQIVSFYVVMGLCCDNLFDHFAKERNISNRSVVLKNLLVEVILFQTWAYV